MEFLIGSFAYYSQDHLKNTTFLGQVQGPGVTGELDEINVHIFSVIPIPIQV